MKTATQQDYEQRILRVLVHVQAHLGDALDLAELAGLAHFSPYHFHRVFRGMVGEPVKEHVRRLRLERAAHRLKVTDQPITRIAFDAGYETHESFTRSFRAMFDESPSGFREAHRRVPLLESPSNVHYSADGALTGFCPIRADEDSIAVRIEVVDPIRVAFVRHVGPYDNAGAAWQKLMAWAGPRGLFGPDTKVLGIGHDDPDVTPSDKIRYDACISVGDDFVAQGEIGAQTTGGGEHAIATHRGPYDQLGAVYAMLMGVWLPAHDREPREVGCFEVYRNSPQRTRPEDLLTDIYVPLKDAGVTYNRG